MTTMYTLHTRHCVVDQSNKIIILILRVNESRMRRTRNK